MDNDIKIKQDIINNKGNIVIDAGAGSGKTSLIIEKIVNILKNKTTHYTIAATTFTNKAANEIKDRLNKSEIRNIMKSCFIGTNDSFVMEEIIIPFKNDVFKFNDLNNIESDYSLKIETFNEGINFFTKDFKIGTYKDPKNNFKFQLALHILKNSLAARRYLKSKYSNLFIDEYQDCDNDMHELYLYICQILNIKLFVVGDKNQCIYMWRGANPKYFEDLSKNNKFSHFKLNKNFRSEKQIQNYTNFFYSKDKNIYTNLDSKDNVLLINNQYKKDLFKLKILDKNRKIAFIVKTNKDAKNLCEEINKMRESFNDFVYIPKTPINNISSSSSWIAEIIVKIIFNKKYNEYTLKNDLPLEINITNLRKMVKNFRNTKNKSEFLTEVRNLYEILGYELNDNEYNAIIETLNNNEYKKAYEDNVHNHVVMTIHSSKGLEFDEVILFSKDYNLTKEEEKNNHYVSITRAKKKLIIFYDIQDDYIRLLKSKYKEKCNSLYFSIYNNEIL